MVKSVSVRTQAQQSNMQCVTEKGDTFDDTLNEILILLIARLSINPQVIDIIKL